ncbi:MAG TPA: DUF418 domain-containing protein [Polyangium sp.]|nr:DUF418 domain-containing protein [Polyangium sp.]
MAHKSAPAESTVALAPVSLDERFPILDVLRGFALFGIAVMNMGGFNTPAGLWARDSMYFPGMADRAMDFFTGVFFAGKANSIFSFLFALGFTIQLQRAASKGQTFVSSYLRRIAILFFMGAVHGILIWNGDVLHVYAVLGLVLLAMRNVSDRTVWVVLILSLLGGQIRGLIFTIRNEPLIHPVSFYRDLSYEHMRIFSEGTYIEQVKARLFLYQDDYSGERLSRLVGPIWGYATFLVTMLMGFYVGRKRWLENISAHVQTIRKMFWICLGLGLSVSIACFALVATRPIPPPQGPTVRGFVTGLLFNFNRPLLCVAYICAFSLLFQKESAKRFLMILAVPGRMPLTNYLMQSIMATTLFNSYGFGLFGKVGPFVGFWISVAMFAIEVVWSHYWLARFRFGPLEWLWRAATYGKFPRMTLDKPNAAAPSVEQAPATN